MTWPSSAAARPVSPPPISCGTRKPTSSSSKPATTSGARSVPVAGYPSNTGALFIYRDTPAEDLAIELGIRTVAFTPWTWIQVIGVKATVRCELDGPILAGVSR